MNYNYLNATLKAFIITIMCLITLSSTKAQSSGFQKDTIKLSLDSAEHIFLRQNLSLLAQKYNIDVNKALEIQVEAALFTMTRM